MMTDTTRTEDPAAIEQDIRRTQEDMSRTVDRIGNQLNFRNLFNALLDKADDNDVDARMQPIGRVVFHHVVTGGDRIQAHVELVELGLDVRAGGVVEGVAERRCVHLVPAARRPRRSYGGG